MKLIIAIIRDDDSEDVIHALTSLGYRVTRVSSTGGLLRRGSTTLMVGVGDDAVDHVITIMQEHCSHTSEPGMKRGTLFIITVDRFVQI
jgi:uncharacterized protein YaaQ